MRSRMVSNGKAIVLLACGSFNPPTNMHLRMFERARDFLQIYLGFRVVEGIISPVNDKYDKKDLESSSHRVQLVELALKTSSWIRVDRWESSLKKWSHTLDVLRYHQDEVRRRYAAGTSATVATDLDASSTSWKHSRASIGDGFVNGHESLPEASQCVPRLMLLCGADMLESFAVPGLWKTSDIEEIIRDFGMVVIARFGSDAQKFVYESDLLTKYKHNIHIVDEWITNDISSTKIRRALRRGESVKYLLPDSVIAYIYEHGLFGTRGGPIPEDVPPHLCSFGSVDDAGSAESHLSSASLGSDSRCSRLNNTVVSAVVEKPAVLAKPKNIVLAQPPQLSAVTDDEDATVKSDSEIAMPNHVVGLPIPVRSPMIFPGRNRSLKVALCNSQSREHQASPSREAVMLSAQPSLPYDYICNAPLEKAVSYPALTRALACLNHPNHDTMNRTTCAKEMQFRSAWAFGSPLHKSAEHLSSSTNAGLLGAAVFKNALGRSLFTSNRSYPVPPQQEEVTWFPKSRTQRAKSMPVIINGNDRVMHAQPPTNTPYDTLPKRQLAGSNIIMRVRKFQIATAPETTV